MGVCSPICISVQNSKQPPDCRLTAVNITLHAAQSSWSNFVLNMWNNVFFTNPHTNINTPISIKDQPYVIFPVDWSICSESASLFPHLPLSSLCLPLTCFHPLPLCFPPCIFLSLGTSVTGQNRPVCCHAQVLVVSLSCLISHTAAPKLQKERKIEKKNDC